VRCIGSGKPSCGVACHPFPCPDEPSKSAAMRMTRQDLETEPTSLNNIICVSQVTHPADPSVIYGRTRTGNVLCRCHTRNPQMNRCGVQIAFCMLERDSGLQCLQSASIGTLCQEGDVKCSETFYWRHEKCLIIDRPCVSTEVDTRLELKDLASQTVAELTKGSHSKDTDKTNVIYNECEGQKRQDIRERSDLTDWKSWWASGYPADPPRAHIAAVSAALQPQFQARLILSKLHMAILIWTTDHIWAAAWLHQASFKPGTFELLAV